MADLHTKTKALMNEPRVLVMGDASQGVRSATKEVSGDSRPAPDPEVAATAKRRQFSSKEKRRILAAADRNPGASARAPPKTGVACCNGRRKTNVAARRSWQSLQPGRFPRMYFL